MTFELKDYQDEIVAEALFEIDSAFTRYGRSAKTTAIGVAAPTGAGKTVVAASIIEQLYFGNDVREPNRGLTILWVTDDGELNEQSRAKIAQASERVSNSQMLTVDASFDQPTFDPGFLYFLNIQKLGEGASRHIRVGESRRHSLWETIGNTIGQRGNSFIVIIDEAHRGSGDSAKPTILRTIIDGGEVKVKNAEGDVIRTAFNSPAPVIVGISATPQKFQTAMAGASAARTLTTIEADIAKVKASGLIKELIDVNYSTDDQPTDDTLIRQAVADLVESDRLWESRRLSTEGRDAVKPLLVIQVPDKVSDKKVAEIVQTLTESWAGFDNPDSISHSFGDHTERTVDTVLGGLPFQRRIQYVSPLDIAKETKIRAVIFMKALTTGWDCPRAEVMVSLRTANEFTDIAQLIGRMVRNPLAKAIDDAEYAELNAVSLYLPKYDAAEVAKVIKSFKDDEDVDADVRVNPVTIGRNPTIPDEVWLAAATLAKELKPSRRYRNEIQRMHGLATLLDNEGFKSKTGEGFEHEAEQLVVTALETEYQRRKKDIDGDAAGLSIASFGKKRYDQHTGAEMSTVERTATISQVNLSGLEAEADRVLPEHSASLYITHVVGNGIDWTDAVTRIAALARIPEVAEALNAAATARIELWRQENNGHVGRIAGEDKRQELHTVWHPIDVHLTEELDLPQNIRVKTQALSDDGETLVDLPAYPKHLYAGPDGLYPDKFNSWEHDVLTAELARETLIGWYRNTGTGLSISYQSGGTDKSLYPDFVFFHQTPTGIAVDIVDPHAHNLADTGPKWAALTRYAREHSSELRRVAAVIKVDDTLKSLNLTGRDEDFETALRDRSGKDSFEQLFAEQGGVY